MVLLFKMEYKKKIKAHYDVLCTPYWRGALLTFSSEAEGLAESWVFFNVARSVDFADQIWVTGEKVWTPPL